MLAVPGVGTVSGQHVHSDCTNDGLIASLNSRKGPVVLW